MLIKTSMDSGSTLFSIRGLKVLKTYVHSAFIRMDMVPIAHVSIGTNNKWALVALEC